MVSRVLLFVRCSLFCAYLIQFLFLYFSFAPPPIHCFPTSQKNKMKLGEIGKWALAGKKLKSDLVWNLHFNVGLALST